jgi:hypothetical protein
MDEELERFEDDLNKSANDDDEFIDLEKNLDLEDDEDLKEEDTDQKVEDSNKEEDGVKSTDEEDDQKAADQDNSTDQPEAKLYTLPDDKEAFGELAGQRVTTKQLEEAELLDKAITWGHQGRHMLTRNQEELEESKKIRALLEEQLGIVKEDRKKAEEAPALPPDQAAEALVSAYQADFDALAKSGAIEDSFFDTYPKVAAQIEHRFRSIKDVADVVIEKVTELMESNDSRTKVETESASRDHLKDLMLDASKGGELFEPLAEDDFRKEFMKWATAEDSGLQWVDKDLNKVTQADITASMLLYLHENPDRFKRKTGKVEEKEEQRRLAGGGGSGTNTKSKSKQPLDEFQEFEEEYNESLAQVEY